jgi:hypothetical protein
LWLIALELLIDEPTTLSVYIDPSIDVMAAHQTRPSVNEPGAVPEEQ